MMIYDLFFGNECLATTEFLFLHPVWVVTRHVKSLRTRYGRDKRQYMNLPSGSAAKEPPEEERIFMKRMSFLYKHVVPRATQNTLVRRVVILKV